MDAKYKILAVDDDVSNLEIIEEILAKAYELKTADSGHQALEILKGFKPDIILLDIMMPEMDGYETCRRIRMAPDMQDTTIIMVSAKGMNADKYKALESGAYDYITKPFTEEDLLESIQFFIEMNARARMNRAKSGPAI